MTACIISHRFHFYDCLVMPVDSIVSTFPWEKVSLLVEYEPLGSILFPDGQLPASLRLRQWLVLKTARDISATSLAKAGFHLSCVGTSLFYVHVC